MNPTVFHCWLHRSLSAVVACAFFFTTAAPVSYAQTVNAMNLPAAGNLVVRSSSFVPVLLKGMTLHPEDPLKFDFIIDDGDTDMPDADVRAEAEKLVKYFMASLTVPSGDLWVNLSPAEPDRIIPAELGRTQLGRDLLAQDYLLKQLTASLMYPEEELGEKFWEKVYNKAVERYGRADLPDNPFHKVWILPESATVYENDKSVFVVNGHLKVMLEEDYLALQKSGDTSGIIPEDSSTGDVKQIIREVILPEIEREVNEGEHFAPLRQIYYSLILAKWYKETIHNSVLSQIYVDQNQVSGVDMNDVSYKQQIYDQYMDAYQKGVFNYIREDYNSLTSEIIPRQYFSGGFKDANLAMLTAPAADVYTKGKPFTMEVNFAQLTLVENLETSVTITGTTVVASDFGKVQINGKKIILTEKELDEAFGEDDGRFADQPEGEEPVKNEAMLAGTSYSGETIENVDELIRNYFQTVIQRQGEYSGLFEHFDIALNYVTQFYDSVQSDRPIILLDTGTISFRAFETEKTIYFEKGFIDEYFIHRRNPELFAQRLFVHLLVPEPSKQLEYEFLFAENQGLTNDRLPHEGVSFRDVINNIDREILGDNDTEESYQDELPFLKKYGIRVKLAGKKAREVSLQAREMAHQFLYQTAINILNGDIDPKAPIRLSENEPVDLVKGRKVRAGVLFYASNPPTIAHEIVVGLGMAPHVNNVLISPTKDFRKFHLKRDENFRFRVKLSRRIEEATGGLIRVWERSDVSNGEERVMPLAELNKEAESFELLYAAGQDHELFAVRSFTMNLEEVTDSNQQALIDHVSQRGYIETLDAHRAKYVDTLKKTGDLISEFKETSDIKKLIELGKSVPKMNGEIVFEQIYDGTVSETLFEEADFNGPTLIKRLKEYRHIKVDDSVDENFHALDQAFWSLYSSEQRTLIENILQDVIKKKNVEDYLHYVRLPGYKNLLQFIKDNELTAIPEQHRKFFDELLTADDPEAHVKDLLKKGEKVFLMKLDVVGKLGLIQEELSQERNAKIIFFNTTRPGQLRIDHLRELKNFPIQANKGIEVNIAATFLRQGFDRIFRGEFDVNLLYAIPRGVLADILAETEEARNFRADMVVNGGEVDLPSSFDRISPFDVVAQRGQDQKAIEDAIILLQKIDLNLGLEVNPPGAEYTEIIISGKDRRSVLTVAMSVKHSGPAGHKMVVQLKVTVTNGETEQLRPVIEDFVFRILPNGSVVWVDKAQLVTFLTQQVQRLQGVGGIDFNAINVNRQGNGVNVEFDPVMLESLKQQGPMGFTPVIINFQRVNSVLPLLGLTGDEGDLPDQKDESHLSLPAAIRQHLKRS